MATHGNPEVNVEMGVAVQGVGEKGMGRLEREIYFQVHLYADEDNDSPEIRQKKRMAHEAVAMWKENLDTSEHQIQQEESEIRSIMNEVYNLVSLYSVFEGVVFAAVATSSRLECQHVWSSVGLSLFAYVMLVYVAFTKFRDIRDLEVAKAFNRWLIKEIRREVSRLRAVGFADFDFDRDFQDRLDPMPSIPFWRNALGLIVPLTIFTVGLVLSLAHILCWS